MTAVDELAVLNSPDGPAHRWAATGLARCGSLLCADAPTAPLLACQVWGIPICPLCWPMGPGGWPDGAERTAQSGRSSEA